MDPGAETAAPRGPRPDDTAAPPGASTDGVVRYPPPGHYLRHLRLRLDPGQQGTVAASLPVLDDLCDHTGALRLGVVATLADFALGVLSTHAASPSWVATHDLGAQLLGRPRGPEVTATGRIVRAGRNTIVSELVVVDGSEGREVVAAATTTYSRLERAVPSGPSAPLQKVVDLAEGDEARRAPLDRYLGFDVSVEAGELRFDHLPHLRNSTGAIQGGVIALAMEWLAAEMAGRAVGRPGPGRATQLQVFFLAGGRTPPFLVRDQVLGHGEGPLGESLHRLELVEEPTGRLLAVGTSRASG